MAVESNMSAWSDGSLHVERFAPKAIEISGADESFEVEFSLSGVTVTVPPERSILDVAEENGVVAISSCREGTCGTCETPMISGKADHRDSILSEGEQKANLTMMICVSRAERGCGKLVLDA
jgi:ferredoxin